MSVVTVSIVVHSTPLAQLEKALDCLLASEAARIYVIDNSADDRLEVVRGKDPRITYRHVANRGFGAGHNEALREILSPEGSDIDNVSSGYHLVMNADVWWEGDIIGSLASYMDSNPDVGLVMPKVFYPDGQLQYACRMLPTPWDVFAKRFLPGRLTHARMERYLLAVHDHDKPLNCPYLLGSFLFFRLEAFRQCGVFDERFFMYPEDIDITRRLHEKWKTMYWPGVSIVHEHAAASRKSMKMLRIHISNMIRYFNKWGWFIDTSRRKFNKTLRDSIVRLPKAKKQPGRG